MSEIKLLVETGGISPTETSQIRLKIRELNEAYSVMVKHLLDNIPDNLSDFKKEFDIFLLKWIDNAVRFGSGSDNIKSFDFSGYGFLNINDAISKLNVLKNSWKDYINIDIIVEGYGIRIDYSLVK